MRFVPPAYYPTGPDQHPVFMPFTMMKSQIEGWPRAIFEAPSWQAPVPGGAVFVMEREAVKTVLQTDAKNFPQGELFKRIMRPAWGKGMLVAEENDWRNQRHAASSAFRPAEMAALTPIFVKSAQAILKDWQGAAGNTVDIGEAMAKLTFNVIIETLLSSLEDLDRVAFADHVNKLFGAMGDLRVSFLLASDHFHKNRPSAVSPSRAYLIDKILKLVARKRTSGESGEFIDLFLKATNPETGEPLSDALVADNILGFIIAGQETTAVTLTWAMYLIAAHAPTRERIVSEVQAVAGNNPIAPDHIAQLVFIRQVICETMRLYPQAFSLTRVAQQACELAGQSLKPGQRVNIPIYAIHRRADVFPDPHAFDPDRFGPDQAAPDRFSYLPFGAGPRICLGAAFSMTEMTAVLATLVRGAAFTPPDQSQVWPIAKLSLRPKGGMPMQVRVQEVAM
jgi:cytochrome P450